MPLIQHFVIRDGHVRLVDEKRHMVLSGTVESRENDVRPGRSGGGGGVFQLQGAGTLNKDPCVGLVSEAQQKGAPVKVSATTTAPSKKR